RTLSRQQRSATNRSGTQSGVEIQMTSPGRWVRSHPGLDNLIAISERGDQGRRHAVKELISRIRCASSLEQYVVLQGDAGATGARTPSAVTYGLRTASVVVALS